MRGWWSAIEALQIGLCFIRLWNHSSYLQIRLLTLTCSTTLAESPFFILPASQTSPLFSLSLRRSKNSRLDKVKVKCVSALHRCVYADYYLRLRGWLCNLALVFGLVKMDSAPVWSEARCSTHFSVRGWWRVVDELCCPRCSEGSHHTACFWQQLLIKTLFLHLVIRYL